MGSTVRSHQGTPHLSKPAVQERQVAAKVEVRRLQST